MNQMLALMAKDLRLLLRDKAGCFFALGFPILYASLFGAIMSGLMHKGPRDIDVVVVDEDGTAASESLVAALEDKPELRVHRQERAAAVELVRRDRAAAYVVVPAGYARARGRMFWGDPPTLELGVSPTQQMVGQMLQGLLYGAVFEGIQNDFADPALMSERLDDALAAVETAEELDPAWKGTLRLFLPALRSFVANMPAGAGGTGNFEPLRIETAELSSAGRRVTIGGGNVYAVTFPQGIAWGIMGCAAGFGISLLTERTSGTLVRLRMAPINALHILAGKALACLVSTLCVAGVLLLLAILAFGVRPHSYALLVMAVLSGALCFVGIMMGVSVIGKTEQSAAGVGWAVLLVLAMIGGGMIPLAFLPGWLKPVSHVSPIKWIITAIEGALWRNYSFTEMLLPCFVLIAMGAVCLVVGTRAFRWTQQR